MIIHLDGDVGCSIPLVIFIVVALIKHEEGVLSCFMYFQYQRLLMQTYIDLGCQQHELD